MKILAPVFALILASCASIGGKGSDWVELERESAAIGSVLHIMGTVHALDLEGGVFVIRDAEGTNFNPTNLPEAFRTDGLVVEAEARRRDDLVSVGMVGPLIELLRIRKYTGEGTDAPGLSSTSWLLEDLAGTGVVDNVQATLEFTEAGMVSGNGSCNRFGGTVNISGSSMNALRSRGRCYTSMLQASRSRSALVGTAPLTIE
jgi:hypothetical protein